MTKTSLFVGRYQPFHDGHKALVESALTREDGRKAVIAVRDTEIDDDNPFTVEERIKMISDKMGKYKDRIQIIAIPDIDEICYGRDVGYKVKKINLYPELEAISGTKIREKMKNDNMANG